MLSLSRLDAQSILHFQFDRRGKKRRAAARGGGGGGGNNEIVFDLYQLMRKGQRKLKAMKERGGEKAAVKRYKPK